MKSDYWLHLKRTVKFGECDSAGIVHFHNLLNWAHQSWEESIHKYGISHKDIFPSTSNKINRGLPIVNCEANFFYPIELGCILNIEIRPKRINNHLLQIKTIFFNESIKAAEVHIVHCSIDLQTKEKIKLPNCLELWIEASNLENKIKEC